MNKRRDETGASHWMRAFACTAPSPGGGEGWEGDTLRNLNEARDRAADALPACFSQGTGRRGVQLSFVLRSTSSPCGQQFFFFHSTHLHWLPGFLSLPFVTISKVNACREKSSEKTHVGNVCSLPRTLLPPISHTSPAAVSCSHRGTFFQPGNGGQSAT